MSFKTSGGFNKMKKKETAYKPFPFPALACCFLCALP